MNDILSAEIRLVVRTRARSRCEYCGVPEWAVLFPHEVDHIIALQHGGTSGLGNLALACFHCNRSKGPNIATLDFESGNLLRLFNPRDDEWMERFELTGGVIRTKSAMARATARLLLFNSQQRIQIRLSLVRSGIWFQRLE